MTLTGQKKTDDGRCELDVTISPETFENAVEKEYHRQKNRLNVQGFRKGKAPRSIVERMYGEGFFYEDALNGMVQEVFDFALRESGIDIIDNPQVTIEGMSKKDGVQMSFSVLLRPELSVKNYKGLKAARHLHTVEDADVGRDLDGMRERNSRLVSVEDRPAAAGDITTIDFEGFVGGVAFDGGKGDDFRLELGSGQFIPGFEEQVAGHSAGESFEITVTFPEDYNAEHLAGKEAVFKINLREIRFKELPEPDDEFAKDVGFDTLDELKEDIKKRLEADRAAEADGHVENQLGDLLAEELEGEVPEVMIESRVDELARDFAYRMSANGLNMEDYLKYSGQDMAAFREGFKENAKKQVKVRLALEAVVRAENISVSDEEVEAEYGKLSESYKMEPEKVRGFIPETELRKDMLAGKALDAVRGYAVLTEEAHSVHEHDAHAHGAHDGQDEPEETEEAE